MEEHHLASYHIRKLTMTTTSLFHENFRHASRLGLNTPVITKKKYHFIFIILKVHILYFLKMWPIFVGSLNNFGRSDNDMIYWKNYDFH